MKIIHTGGGRPQIKLKARCDQKFNGSSDQGHYKRQAYVASCNNKNLLKQKIIRNMQIFALALVAVAAQAVSLQSGPATGGPATGGPASGGPSTGAPPATGGPSGPPALGGMSTEEAESILRTEAEKQFDACDTSGDGTVDDTELLACLIAGGFQSDVAGHIATGFREHEATQGTITKGEFAEGLIAIYDGATAGGATAQDVVGALHDFDPSSVTIQDVNDAIATGAELADASSDAAAGTTAATDAATGTTASTTAALAQVKHSKGHGPGLA